MKNVELFICVDDDDLVDAERVLINGRRYVPAPEVEPVCGNCRHWDTLCPADEHGLCELTIRREQIALHPDSKATVHCDYNASMETARDFGCNQFEGKPR